MKSNAPWVDVGYLIPVAIHCTLDYKLNLR